jgi:hemerythrin-like domain-containing protein
MMQEACDQNRRPAGMSIRQFLQSGLSFCSTLTLHHDIEEARVFPRLGQKMPIFRENERMKNHHKQIHAGLVKLEDYLHTCRSGEKELRLSELKEVMNSFGDVLWTHLDEEVEQLKAENMRKFWTRAEMKNLNF